jgi:hypothetical protein
MSWTWEKRTGKPQRQPREFKLNPRVSHMVFGKAVGKKNPLKLLPK